MKNCSAQSHEMERKAISRLLAQLMPSFGGLWNAPDPILGPAGRDFTWQRRPVPRRRVGLPRFVTVRGGEYFFVPGISALQILSTTEARA